MQIGKPLLKISQKLWGLRMITFLLVLSTTAGYVLIAETPNEYECKVWEGIDNNTLCIEQINL